MSEKDPLSVNDGAADENPAEPEGAGDIDSPEPVSGTADVSEGQVADDDGEDWGTADEDVSPHVREYDPKKDQDLHLLAMQFLGSIAIVGIVMGGVLWSFKGSLPDYLGVVVGSAVTAIAALFSKKG